MYLVFKRPFFRAYTYVFISCIHAKTSLRGNVCVLCYSFLHMQKYKYHKPTYNNKYKSIICDMQPRTLLKIRLLLNVLNSELQTQCLVNIIYHMTPRLGEK